MTLILIADRSFNRYLAVKRVLSETAPDAEVLFAHSGSFALKMLHEVDVDLVVLDLSLPDSGGLDLCGKIKNSYKYQCVQVVAHAQDRSFTMLGAAFKAGADYFFPGNGADDYKLASLIVNVMRLNPERESLTRRPSNHQLLLAS